MGNMSTAVLEPPATTEDLRDRAEELASEVAIHLEPSPQPVESSAFIAARPIDRVTRRDRFFAELRAAVMNIASSDAWHTHGLTTELLLLVERLRDDMEADPDAIDPEWRIRETLQRMLVVLNAMVRQLSHNELDRPEQAARFVAEALADVEVGQVAQLLSTSSRMVTNYRKGEVGQIRKNTARVTLVAQLVHELLGSMTARGVLLWFDARLPQLSGRTARELIDEDPATHRQGLIALARGGRAQLDRGGAADAAVDHAS